MRKELKGPQRLVPMGTYPKGIEERRLLLCRVQGCKMYRQLDARPIRQLAGTHASTRSDVRFDFYFSVSFAWIPTRDMAGRAPRAKEPAPVAATNGKPDTVVQTIMDATGASEEEVKDMLAQCHNDANETTSRLLESNPLNSGVLLLSVYAIVDVVLTLLAGGVADPFSLYVPKKKQLRNKVRKPLLAGRVSGALSNSSAEAPSLSLCLQKEEERKTKETAKVVELDRPRRGGERGGSSRNHRSRGDRGEGRERRGEERSARGKPYIHLSLTNYESSAVITVVCRGFRTLLLIFRRAGSFRSYWAMAMQVIADIMPMVRFPRIMKTTADPGVRMGMVGTIQLQMSQLQMTGTQLLQRNLLQYLLPPGEDWPSCLRSACELLDVL